MAQAFVVRVAYRSDGPRFLLGVASTLATAKALGAEAANTTVDKVDWLVDTYSAYIGATGDRFLIIDRCDIATRTNGVNF